MYWNEVCIFISRSRNFDNILLIPVLSSLAYLEIYVTLAVFFADFDLSLYETDDSSMEWLDHGVAHNKKNVKVRARPLRA